MGKERFNDAGYAMKRLAAMAAQGLADLADAVVEATLQGSYKVVSLSGNLTASENPDEGTETDVIYVNDTQEELRVTIRSDDYRTPWGADIVLRVPAGGYSEANFSNIGGTVFVRGM